MSLYRVLPAALALLACGGPATAGSPSFRVHVVRRGDTVQALSARYGVPEQILVALNFLEHPESLAEGRELVLPPEPDPASEPPEGDGDVVIFEHGDDWEPVADESDVETAEGGDGPAPEPAEPPAVEPAAKTAWRLVRVDLDGDGIREHAIAVRDGQKWTLTVIGRDVRVAPILSGD